MQSAVTTSNNTAYGFKALQLTDSSTGNTAIGSLAGFQITGGYNVAIGAQSATGVTSGAFNIAIGSGTLAFANPTSTIAIGYNAGLNLTDGNGNVFLGQEADVSIGTTTANNRIAIGYQAKVGTNNTAVIGNNTVTTVGGYGAWTNFSDRREKENIQDCALGLDFLARLRPVTYNYLSQPGVTREGLIAQEVESAAQALGVSFHGMEVPSTPEGRYSLSYPSLVIPLINAAKELKARNQALEAQVASQQAALAALQAKVDAILTRLP
jgi:hypothetical protein